MSVQFSDVLKAQKKVSSGKFSVSSIDLQRLGEHASPVLVLDNFRVTGRPFPPHPHAGFSPVTYVFEDSQGDLRSRDSLGNDVNTGPGGIVWTLAGRGVIHEELPANAKRELHGLQIFVNLSPKNKLVAPQMFRLESREVPEWRNDAGNRVRVLTGSFEGLSSPLVPPEPFDFFDVTLRDTVSFDLKNAHNAVVYLLDGRMIVRSDARQQTLEGEQALALYGSGGRVKFEADTASHLVILVGPASHEPMVVSGPFMMNDRSQVEAAVVRYQAGEMGHLDPVS